MRGVRGRLGNASVEAGGGRGGIGARHRAASVRGEEDDKGEEVGWAGQVGELGRLWWAARVRPANFLLSLFYFCFVLFNLFCHCFEFKIIQTMPKTPLNIFIWLDGLFQKLIKYFRGI